MSRGLSSSIKDEFDRTFTPCSSPRVSPLAVLFATRLSREGLRMNFKHKVLLFIDGIVNLLLGVILLFFPAGLLDLLGLPPTNTYFYASILGAVIFGIGALARIVWFPKTCSRSWPWRGDRDQPVRWWCAYGLAGGCAPECSSARESYTVDCGSSGADHRLGGACGEVLEI